MNWRVWKIFFRVWADDGSMKTDVFTHYLVARTLFDAVSEIRNAMPDKRIEIANWESVISLTIYEKLNHAFPLSKPEAPVRAIELADKDEIPF